MITLLKFLYLLYTFYMPCRLSSLSSYRFLESAASSASGPVLTSLCEHLALAVRGGNPSLLLVHADRCCCCPLPLHPITTRTVRLFSDSSRCPSRPRSTGRCSGGPGAWRPRSRSATTGVRPALVRLCRRPGSRQPYRRCRQLVCRVGGDRSRRGTRRCRTSCRPPLTPRHISTT